MPTTAGLTPTETLLDRSGELSAFGDALDRTAAGSGGPLVIEGAAGIGKTRLLTALRELAERRGFRTIEARGGEFERDHPFGLVRQLFGDAPDAGIGDADIGWPHDRGPDGDRSLAIIDRAYRLVAGRAADGPLLVVVDDAHWADPSSLLWLGYTVRRIGALPVLFAIAQRPLDADEAALIGPVLSEPSAVHLHPRPLSRDACGLLVADVLPDPAPEFVRACVATTGGNPFYLTELLRELVAEDVAPSAASTPRVLELSPAAVERTTLARIRMLPADALPLARAAAVLGADAELRYAAVVAGLEHAAASHAAEALMAAGILKETWPLEFAHPIVRRAITADMSAPAVERLHANAARVLADGGAGPEQVAGHLLGTQPANDPWVSSVLRRAALAAAADGAAAAAARYLRRALVEPVPEGERLDTLHRLGVAEALSGGEAARHLGQAHKLSTDPVQRGRIAADLARSLLVDGRAADAVAILADAIDALPDAERELGLRLETELLMFAHGSPAAAAAAHGRGPRFTADPDRLATPGERFAAAPLVPVEATRGRDAAKSIQLARQILDAGFLDEVGADAPALYLVVLGLIYGGAYLDAERELNAAIDHARTRGSIRGYAMATIWLSAVRLRRGRVAEAVAAARESLAAHAQLGMVLGRPIVTAFLVESLIEQGALEDAEAALAGVEPGDFVLSDFLRHAQGRLALARGRPADALELFLAAGRNHEAWGVRAPVIAAWRSGAAIALARLGRLDEARVLAEEELAIAREYGSRPVLGVAFRSAALVSEGDPIPHLEASVDVLATSDAELEHARSLAELGSALRRAGRRAESRERLREALDQAHGLGARAVADLARGELVAAGAKPRRDALRGRDALTPSERRIARMAAEGFTNRKIAQDLYLAPKTVEMHLGRVYRKLGISSRTQLQAALDATPEPSA